MPVYKDNKKTTDGRQYYFAISYKENGKYKRYKSKRFKTKKEAEQEEAIYLLSTGKNGDTNAITFNNVIETYLQAKIKALKPQSYKRVITTTDHIKKVLGGVSMAQMTRRQYEDFREYLETSGLSVIYMNKINTQLKTLLQFAKSRYDIVNEIPYKYDVFKDTSNKVKEMDFYTLQEFNQFIDVVDDPRFKALFTCLFYQGLRIGEANALTWEKIDFEKKQINVNCTITTKMHDSNGNYLITTPKTKAGNRILPMCKKVLDSLKMLYTTQSAMDCFNDGWHCFGGLNAIPETTIQKANAKYSKIAGIKKIRIHDFRHSCASLLINNGANITLVSKYLGHSDIEMTLNTYSHFYKSKLEELMDVLDEL